LGLDEAAGAGLRTRLTDRLRGACPNRAVGARIGVPRLGWREQLGVGGAAGRRRRQSRLRL